jgi:TPR repeat protein
MQDLVVNLRKHRKKALYFGALAVALLGLPISPSSNSEQFQFQLSGVALAQSENISEELGSMKQVAGGYQGSVEVQKRIGDIYLGKYNDKYYNGKLYGDKERNSVEAYVWYALAVARKSHNELLEEALRYDPSLQLENLSERDMEIINDATSAYNRLAAQSRFRKGAAGWLAEKIFTDHYKRGPAASYYLLGKMYRSGEYFVRQSYYDAYVTMRVAALVGFANADELANEYRGHITFNQIEVAEREAAGLMSKTFGGGGGATGGGYYTGSGQAATGSAISSGQGWGPDFHANRAHRDAGTSKAMTPNGVDAHNIAAASFDQGNALLAAGRINEAKGAYEAAISAEPSSIAAFNASRRLQTLTLTCSLRDDRIRRMVRPENRDRVDEISWERIQIALKALGHFPEFVDGKPDLKTRRAIRAFQRNDLNIDETGYLTTDQRVELICAAAQDVRDPDSQIQLGIMYARGIGLNCNTAAAHAWFQRAADQGHPTALYNLGLMYLEGFYDHQAPGSYPEGTREYLTNPNEPSGASSIKPRKIRDFDMARYFFEEAKAKGHPKADTRISEIKSGKIDKILRENSIVGCIDYEAEIEIDQLGQDAAALNTRVSIVLGQLAAAESGPTDQMCKDLKALDTERVGLAKEADNYSSYSTTRATLYDVATKISAGMNSCSAN